MQHSRLNNDGIYNMKLSRIGCLILNEKPGRNNNITVSVTEGECKMYCKKSSRTFCEKFAGKIPRIFNVGTHIHIIFHLYVEHLLFHSEKSQINSYTISGHQ